MAFNTPRGADALQIQPETPRLFTTFENPADTSVSGGGGSCHSVKFRLSSTPLCFSKTRPSETLRSHGEYWVTFADTGKPGRGGVATKDQPERPAYERNTEQVMELGHQDIAACKSRRVCVDIRATFGTRYPTRSGATPTAGQILNHSLHLEQCETFI